MNIHDLIVSEGGESGSGLAERVWLRVFHEVALEAVDV